MTSARSLVGLACALLAGCTGALSRINAATHTVTYKKEGFVVEDVRRKFTYDDRKRVETAVIENAVTLVDEGCDGEVDEITDAGGTWRRGEPGTEGLITEASAKFLDVRTYLRIDAYHETWKAMTPAEIARSGGLSIRE